MATQEPVAPSTRQPAAQGCDHGQEEPEADVKAAEERAADELKSSRETAASRSDLVAMLVANVILVLGYALAVWFQALDYRTVGGCFQRPGGGTRTISQQQRQVEQSCFDTVHSCGSFGHCRLRLLVEEGLRRGRCGPVDILLRSASDGDTGPGPSGPGDREAVMEGVITSDRIDFVANVLVFVLSVTGVVLRHMQHSPKEAFEERSDRLEMATVPLRHLQSITSRSKVSQQSGNGRLEESQGRAWDSGGRVETIPQPLHPNDELFSSRVDPFGLDKVDIPMEEFCETIGQAILPAER
ncbi:hypothetical protein THAOC_18015 [Thalassiosira oceanica]|uniref:Uncharacterized protein n=1 Tax=Thalassiosira oceanica TaxID=159749 RepID=K0SKI0_THAOC|nr:hypothetical protein THAOC_18015 [Thalassiosira oceanica]|eukprot:EJK61491.1 hypothetical protein THAOC_18015 [Thalassiosira oceanica]